ncbi:MAG: hypothetical protein ABL973_20560 [Micropepsaceae bacterium]
MPGVLAIWPGRDLAAMPVGAVHAQAVAQGHEAAGVDEAFAEVGCAAHGQPCLMNAWGFKPTR